jgi:hypothetical protein
MPEMPAIVTFYTDTGMIVATLFASILLLHISTIDAYTSRF